MTSTDKDKIAEQQKIIEELTAHVAKYETMAHELQQTQNKLDAQISTYDLIHKYTQMAFTYEEEDLYNIIAEGVVDVFQLEVGATYGIDLERNMLVALGSCNLPEDAREVQIPDSHDWFIMLEDARNEFIFESPVTNPMWKQFGYSMVVAYVIKNNKKQPEGIVFGGIFEESKVFYDFSVEVSKPSFIVYCQQMNGISNNFDAIKQAKQAGDAKTRFLANLSHEIRTPMNAILGMTKIAERSENIDDVMRCVKQIDGSSHHLLTLINDVLDISKVEEGKLSLAHNSFLLSEMIDLLLNSITPNADEKSQKLIVNRDEVKIDEFAGDSLRLSQVLINILSNAVKFTPEGGRIELNIKVIKKDKEKMYLMFSITDTGIGIEDHKIDTIFKPFEQADGSISRKYGGTGLGLAISKRIVELMGGEIKVESQVKKGTTFSFNIWLDIDKEHSIDGTALESDKQDNNDHDLTGKKIMIVDDVDINREIVKTFLSETGALIVEAEDGQEAFDLFEESDLGEYSLILMDMQMPIIDGCTATEMIRSLERPDAKSIPIYAMTANVFKEDVQQVIDSGMNGHIGKPVDYDIVINTVADAIIS